MGEERDVIVIGGGAGGYTSATYAKKFNRKSRVLVISKENDFYSRCSLPFVISGEIESFEKIKHNLKELCNSSGIDFILDEVTKINIDEKKVFTKNGSSLSYKSLIIATGSEAFVPPVPGIKDIKEGIFTLKGISDAENIWNYAKRSDVKSALVMGGGAIGVELATVLKEFGLDVTLVELMQCLLPTCFSLDFSEIIHEKLKENEVNIIVGKPVDKIIGEEKVEKVIVGSIEIPVDMVLVSVGVKPNVTVFENISGLEFENGGIKINERMQTSIPDIYAVGDCVSFRSLITKKAMFSQLGTMAIKEGKIAGVNAVGGNEKIKGNGVLNSIVIKLFDIEIGATGITESAAKNEGIDIVTGKIKTGTKESYHPKSRDIAVKLVIKKDDEKLIGGEIIGGEGVAEKIDLIAFAIQKGATLDDIKDIDYCYTPPVISAHNALVLAAENARRKLDRMKK